MSKRTLLPKSPEKRNFKKRSSAQARRLIEAAVRRHGNEVKAARALGLPNSTQLNKMRKGLLKDTPAMRAALLRAKHRAERAWAFVPEPKESKAVDVESLRAALTMLGANFEMVMELIPKTN